MKRQEKNAPKGATQENEEGESDNSVGGKEENIQLAQIQFGHVDKRSAAQSSEEEIEQSPHPDTEETKQPNPDETETTQANQLDNDDNEDPPKPAQKERKKTKTGVIYISRIPPGMCEGALRARLGRIGKLGRVWLRPEDAQRVRDRQAMGGSRKRVPTFKDGWAEFLKRSHAKKAVELLNSQPMSASKRPGRWSNDLWCLKYLKAYTWDDLVEETCGTKRERILRIKAEVAAARREKAYVEGQAVLAKKIAAKDGDGETPPPRLPVRRFRQKRPIGYGVYDDDVDERRAREAQERVDAEIEGVQKNRTQVDAELVSMLFKKRKVEGASKS